jgi:hypothetical protein
MGEMADMHDGFDGWYDDDDYGPQNRFDQFRDDMWQTKDGKEIAIRDMSNSHLMAAFRMFGDERLRDEMLIRMFEVIKKPRIHF